MTRGEAGSGGGEAKTAPREKGAGPSAAASVAARSLITCAWRGHLTPPDSALISDGTVLLVADAVVEPWLTELRAHSKENAYGLPADAGRVQALFDEWSGEVGACTTVESWSAEENEETGFEYVSLNGGSHIFDGRKLALAVLSTGGDQIMLGASKPRVGERPTLILKQGRVVAAIMPCSRNEEFLP